MRGRSSTLLPRWEKGRRALRHRKETRPAGDEPQIRTAGVRSPGAGLRDEEVFAGEVDGDGDNLNKFNQEFSILPKVRILFGPAF